jgi:hypothetical protein
MHSTNYGRTIQRCFWWAMVAIAAGFVLSILPINLGPVFSVLVLVAAGLLMFRATYYLGRYEEAMSGGDEQWSLFDNDPAE